MNSNFDVVIIGAGPAGLAASIYALERNLTTLVLEAATPGGQLVRLYPDKEIYDYPSYPAISGRELARKMADHAEKEGARVMIDSQVEEITREGSEFVLRVAGSSLRGRSVLLATGMGHYEPRKLKVEGEETLVGKGIYYQKLPERVTGKRLVVVGGGDTALERAVAAAEKGATVTIVHRSAQFRALEKTVAKAKTLSIPSYLSSQVVAIHGSDRVESVEVFKGSGARSIFSCDAVVVCVGVELDNTFLTKLGLKVESQALVTDQNLQTSVPGIFAAGDVVVPAGKYRRITVAVGSAATAINGTYQFLKHPYWSKIRASAENR